MSFFNNAKFVAAVPSSNPFMIYSRHADRYLDNEVFAFIFILFCLLDPTLYFLTVICFIYQITLVLVVWTLLQIYFMSFWIAYDGLKYKLKS